MRVIKENHEKFVAKWRHLREPAFEPETAGRAAAMSGPRLTLGGLRALRNGR